MLDKMRLLTPGPTPLPEEVRLALARDMIHHRKSQFKKILAEAQAGLKYLFGTSQPVLPLTASGTGAMTAAVTNLFAPGDKVLVIEGGKFAERWTALANTYGLKPTVLPVEWGTAVDPEAVRRELDKDPGLRGVMVQASETSTGVMHPVRELAALTRERDALLVVDGISAVGLSPCPMDEWSVDCLLTGSQKGLMLPPGLAFIALSERAWQRASKVGPRDFYFNLQGERDNAAKDQTLFTPAIGLLVALCESMKLFKEQGLENIYRKQWAMTRMTRAGVEAMGVKLLAQEPHCAWGLTSIRLPEGVDGLKLLAVAAERYGVLFAGGQDRLKGRIVRFGHMGHVDFGDVLAGLAAFNGSLAACGGYSACRDYLETAMRAYDEALAAGPATL